MNFCEALFGVFSWEKLPAPHPSPDRRSNVGVHRRTSAKISKNTCVWWADNQHKSVPNHIAPCYCLLIVKIWAGMTVSRTHLQWDNFTKLSLSNIMRYGESDVEWQISIQGVHLNSFWNYFWKREGSFKLNIHYEMTKWQYINVVTWN